MKELKTSFIGTGEVRGMEFTQIYVNKSGFMYEVKLDGVTTHYEVFMRKVNSMYQNISYPKSKAFGVWAWTCKTLEKAKEKFNEITEEEDEKIQIT